MAAGDRALSRVGRARRSREALAARLGDGHHDTREAAIYGLAIRLDPRAVPVLLDFLDDYEDPMLDSAPGGRQRSGVAGNDLDMTNQLDLTAFKALSFDCYGTLIDWEAGIAAVLGPWAREQGLDVKDEELLLAYADNEAAVERERPSALYPEVLAEAFRRTGEALGAAVGDEWAARLGGSVPDWPAFPDSAEALARLGRHYRLIIVSNVHRAGFAGSNERLRGDFAAIITAEDVGAYKPAANHFRALDAALPALGVDRAELLHVAQSLFHDHVPAKREGLPSVWINRRHDRPGWGATPEPDEDFSYDLEFESMAGFADAVDAAFAG